MRQVAVLGVAATMLLACCGGGSGDGDAALFCQRLDRLTRNDPFAAFGDTASAEDVEAAFTALVDRAEGLEDVAPPEVRPAASDYADAVTELDSLLAGAAYDPTLVDVTAYRRQQQAYADAARRLQRYLRAEC